jgi:hypothetical protein
MYIFKEGHICQQQSLKPVSNVVWERLVSFGTINIYEYLSNVLSAIITTSAV